METILEEIRSPPTSADNLNLLQLQLQEQLSNKKFLLVLDDVWNLNPRDEGYMELSDREGWERLRTPLLAAAEGSKIVVTSSNKSVAEAMKAAPTHDLGKLSSEDSWSLFKKHAFGDRDPNAFLELERIGRQIVDKCQGLPLAVKALGCLLYSKDEKMEWDDVLRSEIWHPQRGSEILPSLILSYHHLSLPLKHCFAYCSIFPQDHQFNKEKLILLWMAEGLLHPQQNEGRRMEGIVFIVSNQDEHRRFLMINKVSIMTMEETCKLAVIGRPCKMCSNQVDFCKRKWNMKKDRLSDFPCRGREIPGCSTLDAHCSVQED